MTSISHIPEQFRDARTRYEFFLWVRELPASWSVKKNLMFLWGKVTESPIDEGDLFMAGAEDPNRA